MSTHTRLIHESLIHQRRRWRDLENTKLEKKTRNGIHIFNIGPKDKGVFVKDIAKKIAIRFGKNAKINYEKKKQGWVGDIPSFHYNISKLLNLGFKKKILNSDRAINKCISEIE